MIEARQRLDRGNVAFWILGICNNFTFVFFISCAEDILTGLSGVILLCTILPGLVTKSLSFYVDRIPYLARISAVALTSTVAFVAVAFASSVHTKLVLIALQSAVGALGEISFLALTARYSPSTVGAWSSGTGGAGIFGAGIYYSLRHRLGLSAETSLLVVAPIPLLLIIVYVFVLLPVQQNDDSYSELHDMNELHDMSSAQGDQDGAGDDDSTSVRERGDTRQSYFPHLFVNYIAPLCLVYFAEYSINQGTLGTLSKFRSGAQNLDGKRLYSMYQFVYQVGVFASRSSIGVVQIERLWLLSCLQGVNLVILTLCSMYALLPSPIAASGIVLWEGLLGGAVYVNAFYMLRNKCPVHLREWALAVATLGDATGICFAAVFSISLEPFILNFQKATS